MVCCSKLRPGSHGGERERERETLLRGHTCYLVIYMTPDNQADLYQRAWLPRSAWAPVVTFRMKGIIPLVAYTSLVIL